MPTEILTPDTQSVVAFTPVIAVSNLEAALNDDDTKYNKSSVDAARDLFGLRALSWNARIVSSVDMSFRARSSAGTPTCRSLVKLGANTTLGASHTLSTAWATYTDAGLARPGGGTWGVQNVNDMLGGYETIACGGNEVWISNLRASLVVSYPDAMIADPDGIRRIVSATEAPPEPVRYRVTIALIADPPVGPTGDVSYLDGDANHAISYQTTLPGIAQPVWITLSRASVANRPTP